VSGTGKFAVPGSLHSGKPATGNGQPAISIMSPDLTEFAALAIPGP